MPHSKVRIENELDSVILDDLVSGRILALIVRNYYAKDLTERLCEKILQSKNIEPYTHEVVSEGKIEQLYFGVDRLGSPFNLLYNESDSSPASDRYYAESRRAIKRLRDYCDPAPTPIDRLRLELDEKFRFGANIASFRNRKMMAGIVRIAHANLSHQSAEQPHFDALPEKYAKLDAQLAANIYLQVPQEGGELEIWDVNPLNPLARVPKDWRKELPDPIKIKPEQGDLIIFNCRCPHAIGTFEGKPRITAQMFIGYQKEKALHLWN